MAEDIVSALREFAGADPDAWQAREAADEIERLRSKVQHVRVALFLAVEELCGYGPSHHDASFDHFLEQARRG